MKKLNKHFCILLIFTLCAFFSFSQTQLSQIKKGRVYKNYLKTSYELSNYDDWLSSDDIYYNGIRYPFGGLLDQQYCQIDINGDGLEDIFYYDTYPLDVPLVYTPPSIYMNNGVILEKVGWTGPTIIHPHGSKLLVGDFNNDSLPDIFTSVAYDIPLNGIGDTVGLNQISHLIFNSSNGLKTVKEFTEQKSYHHTSSSGDIDNDGDLDIMMFNFSYFNNWLTSKILWNDGKGNFTFKEGGFSKIAPIHHSELFDVNSDGFLDLVIVCVDSHLKPTKDVIIMWGNGKDFNLSNSSSFVLPYNEFTQDIDFVDINTDGISEIIISGIVMKEYPDGDYNIYYVDLYQSEDNGKTFLRKTNQYFDVTNFPRFGHMIVNDLDKNEKMDIYAGDRKDSIRWEWNGSKFIYLKPKSDSPIIKDYSYTNDGKLNLFWERANQSTIKNKWIENWAIYCSDKPWIDTSESSKPIYVSAKESVSESGIEQWTINPTSKEMFIRISAIDIFGVESKLSNLLKITIPSPIISGATICSETNLTIRGSNFIGITNITIGDSSIVSYEVLSNSMIQALIRPGHSGNVSVNNVAGISTSSVSSFVIPATLSFIINGPEFPFAGTIVTYSLPELKGIDFEWLFPEGWEQISGGTSNVVKVKTGTHDGTIKVIPSVICGNLIPVMMPVEVYTYVPDDNFQKALRDKGIDKKNRDDCVLYSSISNVTELFIDSRNISDLTGIQNFKYLKKLDCSNNQLESLDLTKNTELNELICSVNKLTSLDLSQNKSLTVLFCDGNTLTSLDLSNNVALYTLGCGINRLSSIDLSKNIELAHLSIYASTISSIDLSNNKNLILFHCGFNKLSQLDVSKNLELRELACDANQITNLNLSNNTKLTHLICNGNNLSSLNLKNGNNASLKEMYADGNPNLTCINVDNPTLAGTYLDWHKDETATYSDNCIQTSNESLEFDNSIVINPNPSKGIFNIEGLPTNQNNTISLYSIDGRLIRKKISSLPSESIDLSNHHSGIYMVFINNQPFKIMKE